MRISPKHLTQQLDTITYWPQWIAATLIGLALDEIQLRKIRKATRG